MEVNSGYPRLLIHVGYHKTGTSYLQRLIFNDTKMGFRTPIDRHLTRNVLVRTDAFSFDIKIARDLFRPDIDRTIADKLVPVLTHEQFSGQPPGGGYGLRRREREASRREVADRLYATFPEALVLIVIREQREMISSIYKWLVAGWEGRLSARIDQFLDQSPLEQGFSPLFNLSYLEYDQLIRYYQSLYGAMSVLVLPFEEMSSDILSFVNRIRVFVGLEPTEDVPKTRVNSGRSAAACYPRRWLNRMLVSPNQPGVIGRHERTAADLTNWINRHIPRRYLEASEAALYNRISNLVGETYAASNQKTSILTGLDLDAMGYVTRT